MKQPTLLKEQISREIFRLLGTYAVATTILIMALAFCAVYYYQKEEFKHYKALISTKLDSDLQVAFQQAVNLTQSPNVWTSLTDSVGRVKYLQPILAKANQNPNFKFELLDYRGREFIQINNTAIALMDVLVSVQETLQDDETHYEILQIGANPYLVVSLPIKTNFTDGVVGILLMYFDIDKSLSSVEIPKDLVVKIKSDILDEAPFRFYEQGENFKLEWQAEGRAFTIPIKIVQNFTAAVLFILSGLGVSVLCGAFLYVRMKDWTNSFALRTTSRLDSLVLLADSTLKGSSIQSNIDDSGDEISEVSNALQGILLKQRETTQKLTIFSRVFDTAAEAILVSNKRGLIVDVNNALLEMTGYKREALIGQPAGLLYLKENTEKDIADIAETVRQRGVWRGETFFLSSQKSSIPVLLSVSMLRDSEGLIQGHVSVFSDISPIRKAEQQLKKLLHEDQLTGLPNFQGFLVHMNERTHGECFALLFIDLDNFKSINDTFGHDQGDEAICMIAQHLKAVLPAGTFLCRRSGDEFIAVVTVAEPLENFKEKLQRLIKPLYMQLTGMGSANLTATFSAGAALYPADSGKLSELLIFADTALLSAKEAGRNQIRWLDSQMMIATSRKSKIDNKLALAIDQGKIHPHYQPEVDLLTGNIIGFEALARWYDEELGVVSPSEFITLAEQSGVISSLTQSLFAQVVADSQAIKARFPGVCMAINSSPQLLAGKWLFTLLSNLSSDSKNRLDGFVLEITESDLSLSPQETSIQLQAIMDLGVKIAIDDFGKSYSSLSRLASMPIQKLKIDMSFTEGLDREENFKIIAGILALAQSLELEVTAEGIETQSQLEALVRLGCIQGQGYFYSRPLPLLDVLALPRNLRSVQLA
jgi:diguanylate cyclase (GGDEF)-like protein/PAS domain S-box-containing protein